MHPHGLGHTLAAQSARLRHAGRARGAGPVGGGAGYIGSVTTERAATPIVLFLCVHNAGRSQMAAGFMRHLGGDGVAVFSGGSEPAAEVNPSAIVAMAEVGVDIAGYEPRRWDDDTLRSADVVVTMGCGDECPVYPGKRYLDWELDDPAGQSVEDVRPIRDEIKARVQGLLVELGVAESLQ